MNQNAPDSPAADALPRWALRATALALIALGIVPMANMLTLADPQLWWPTAVRSWIAWGAFVGITALVLGRTLPRQCEMFHAYLESRLLGGTPRHFALFIAALTCALAIFFSWLLFRFHPTSLDELSAQWQGHILASGHLVARAEAREEFFSTPQTVSLYGKWFAHFPIGGPLLQGVGQLLRVSWLVNPALVAVAAVAVYRFVAAIATESQARGTALLFALSPFVLFMAGSQRDHVGTLAAVWIALVALTHWDAAITERDTVRAAAVIGLGLGAAATIRPYDGVLVTLAVGTFQLCVAGRNAARWRSLAVQALAGAVPIALLLAVNRAMTGHPLMFAYDVLNGPEHRPGFHMSPMGFVHTPRHGVYLVSSYLMRLNAALLGWPVPIVGLVALAMVLQRRASRWDNLLAILIATTLTGYFLYWGEGLFSNGPRFLYTIAPVFLIYVARLPGALRDRTRSRHLRAAVSLLVPLWVAAAWFTPVGIQQPFAVWTVAARAQQIESVAPGIVDATRQSALTNALVFVNDGWQARLTSRLRALGAPPFLALQTVARYDACALQQRLDAAERSGMPRDQQATWVFAILDQPMTARPLPGLAPGEQISLEPGRKLPAECQGESNRMRGHGADMASLLPLMSLDSTGRLNDNVIYARDFGVRNELLRDRFPTRRWYVARIEPGGASASIVLDPYQRMR